MTYFDKIQKFLSEQNSINEQEQSVLKCEADIIVSGRGLDYEWSNETKVIINKLNGVEQENLYKIIGEALRREIKGPYDENTEEAIVG